MSHSLLDMALHISCHLICSWSVPRVQVYIAFLPPRHLHPESSLSLTFLLLTGCLSYANSAINPILYAFLSENFKKSFAKAFTCAAKQDVNAQLNGENSVNPRTTRGASSRGALCDSKMGKSSRRDRNRHRDNLGQREEESEDDPHAFTNYVVHMKDGVRNRDAEDDLDDDEDEPEVVEIEDCPNAIPMTTRLTSYMMGSVMGNREKSRRKNDEQILLDEPMKTDGQPNPNVL